MTLEILQTEMFAAMKNKDKPRKDAISSLVDAVKKAGIDKKCRDNIPESLVDEVILKEQKVAQEMVAQCPGERVDLLEEYLTRLSVINEFTPILLTDEKDISDLIYQLLTPIDVKATGKSQVMKLIMPQLKGKVNMKIASKVLNEILKQHLEV